MPVAYGLACLGKPGSPCKAPPTPTSPVFSPTDALQEPVQIRPALQLSCTEPAAVSPTPQIKDHPTSQQCLQRVPPHHACNVLLVTVDLCLDHFTLRPDGPWVLERQTRPSSLPQQCQHRHLLHQLRPQVCGVRCHHTSVPCESPHACCPTTKPTSARARCC